MRLTAAGDRAAFDRLVDRHAPALFRFARTLTTSHAAEDAIQEAFLGAWRGASTYRGETGVRSWLLAIVRNAVYRQHRHRVDEPADTEPLSTLGADAGWGEGNPETIAIAKESRALLTAAMQKLSTQDQEILVLRDLEGLPGEQVASMLGVNIATMKTRLHRARLRLAAKVKEA